MVSLCHYPDYALKRSNEFLQLGKYMEATDCLYDFLKNKKNRMLINAHETVVKKLLNICVGHKMSHIAKDALYLYRIICQGVNIKSWEDTINNFLEEIDEKVESAKKLTLTANTDFTSPCETVTPEMLLECVTNEDNQDRINRIVLFPWIKFSWECYRFCLDLLRNSQGEKFYHAVAQRAFKFCLRYSRKNEFRKLCNILRLHLSQLQKRQLQEYSVLHNPELQMLYLETGMTELESAIKLEDWQDAFKAVEDIHWALNMLKKPPHSRILAIYYEKLSFLFWKANDLLYHAAAILRYFLLAREMKKNFANEDISNLSTQLILAILSVPLPTVNPTIDLIAENDESIIEKRHRLLTMLLDLPSRPSRKTLIKDVEQYKILNIAPVEVYNVFRLLEYEVKPLTLKTELTMNFNIIQETKKEFELEKYIQPIYKVTVVILISQLSKLYTNISLSKLKSLSPPLDDYFLEILVVDIARKYNFPLRIDHGNQCIHFNSPLYMFQNIEPSHKLENFASLKDQHFHLAQIHSSLLKAEKLFSKPDKIDNEMLIREEIIKEYIGKGEHFRSNVKERKKMIDRYKEMIDNNKMKKEEEDKKRAVDIQLKYEAAEKERLLRETEERDIQRRLREQDEMRKQILLEKMEILKKSEIGPLIEKYNLNDMETLDPETLFCKHIEFINRERKGFLKRLKGQERSIDHFERAKRVEESPLLKAKYENEEKSARLQWEENEKERIFKICEHRKYLVHTKTRMKDMQKDLEAFVDKVKENKTAEQEEERKYFSELLNKERKKRLKERAELRKAQRKQAWIDEQSLKLKRQNNNKLKQTSATPAIKDKRPVHTAFTRNSEKSVKSFVNDPDYLKYASKFGGNNQRIDIQETYMSPKILRKDIDGHISVNKKSHTERQLPKNSGNERYVRDMVQPFHILKRENQKRPSMETHAQGNRMIRKTELNNFTVPSPYDQTSFDKNYSRNYDKDYSKNCDNYPKKYDQNLSNKYDPDTYKRNDKYSIRRSDRFNESTSRSWRQPDEKILKYDINDSRGYRDTSNFNSSLQKNERLFRFDQNKGFNTKLISQDNYQEQEEIERKKFDKARSCTPWAKLSRKKTHPDEE